MIKITFVCFVFVILTQLITSFEELSDTIKAVGLYAINIFISWQIGSFIFKKITEEFFTLNDHGNKAILVTGWWKISQNLF